MDGAVHENAELKEFKIAVGRRKSLRELFMAGYVSVDLFEGGNMDGTQILSCFWIIALWNAGHRNLKKLAESFLIAFIWNVLISTQSVKTALSIELIL